MDPVPSTPTVIDFQSPFSVHFDTDYVPTPEEFDAIEKFIHERQNVVKQLEERVHELERLRMEIEKTKERHTEFIRKHRNLIPVSRRIPADVLSTIFGMCLPIHLPLTDTGSHSPHPSVAVSHVCRLWRSVALETPLLWTQIEISTPRVARTTDDWIEEWTEVVTRRCHRAQQFMARAMTLPLHITIIAFDPISASSGDPLGYMAWDGTMASYQARSFVARNSTYIGVMLATIGRLLQHHCKSVHLFLRFNSDSGVHAAEHLLTIPALLTNGYPTSLIVEIEPLNPLGYSINSSVFGGPTKIDLGSLYTRIVVTMRYTDMRLMNWNWISVTDLDLRSPDGFDGSLVAQNALEVLSATPNLRCFAVRLSREEDVQGTWEQGNVRLRLLHSLTLIGNETTLSFAASLELPSLTRLAVRSGGNPAGACQTTDALEFLVQRYGANLTSLECDLEYLWMQQFPHFFIKLPTLERLHLPSSSAQYQHFGPTTSHYTFMCILSSLTPALSDSAPGFSTNSGRCCPSLRALICDMDGASKDVRQAVITFVQARRSGQRDHGSVGWLEEVDIAWPNGEADTMAEELRSRGVDMAGVRFRSGN